nr:MAG TPA: hypothetical protein [Caudoviricetes sp.]DAW74379.1 MAG TPA: hypothetical protein [Caudoviricetes sp.]
MVGGGALKQFTPRFLSVIFRCDVKHVFLSCFNDTKPVCLKYQGNKVLIQTKE